MINLSVSKNNARNVTIASLLSIFRNSKIIDNNIIKLKKFTGRLIKNSGIQLNKKNILDLYYRTNNRNIEDGVLKELIECKGFKTLDTYIRDNVSISIIQFIGSNSVVTIEKSDTSLSIEKKKPYKTKEMVEKYKGEENGDYFGTKVKYLNKNTRKKHRLDIINGMFYQGGKPYNYKSSRHYSTMFVMDKNGIIYCNNQCPLGKFHHSSFFAGNPVACAGELKIVNGKLKSINNNNGHYWPEGDMVEQFVRELGSRGVNLDGVELLIAT